MVIPAVNGNIIGTAVLEIVTDSTKADAGLTAFQKRVAIGTAVAFGVAVHEGAQFETTLAKIGNFTNANATDLSRMRSEVLALGPAVGRGPQELADALYSITSAGQYGSNALDILTASAKGSVSGLGETKDIAKVVVSAVNAYGAANLSAAKATDVLIAAVREGSAEPEELANQLGRVIGVAAQMGVRFDDVAAAVAVLTKNGIDTDQAVTGLRTTLLALNNPAVQAGAALKGVNLDAAAIRRTIREQGLIEGLRQLSEAFGGDTEKIAEVIPEARALVAVFGLVGKASGEAADVQKRVREATGLTEETFARASRTAGVQFQRALASVMTILVLLGSEVLPPITAGLAEIADALGHVTDAFQLLPAPIRQTVVVMGLLAALAPVINALLLRGQIAWAASTTSIMANTVAMRANAAAAREAQVAAGVSGNLTGGAAASFAVFERGEQAAKRWATAMSVARVVGIGAGLTLGSMAQQSDNLTVSMLGTVAQATALGATFGAHGAIIGALVGSLMALVGANDAVTASIKRQHDAMMQEAAEIARTSTRGEIQNELTARLAAVERVRTAINEAQRGGFAGGGGARLDALRDELFEAQRRAETYANALNIVSGNEDRLKGATDGVTNALHGATGAAAGFVGALTDADREVNDAVSLMDVLASKVLSIDDVFRIVKESGQGLEDPFVSAMNSVAESADDMAMRTLAAIERIQRGAATTGPRIGRSLADELKLALADKAILDAQDPTGAIRKQIADARGGGSTAPGPLQRMAQRRTEGEAEAVRVAMITGTPSAEAVAKVRAEYARLDAMWPKFADNLRAAGIQVTDDMREMFDRMTDTSAAALEILTNRNKDIVDAIAGALNEGSSVDVAVGSVTAQQERLRGLLGTFEAEVTKYGGVVDDRMRAMFLGLKATTSQQTNELEGLIGGLLVRRVGMGMRGLLYNGQDVTSGNSGPVMTQHNQITLAVPDPERIDVPGAVDALRYAGFGAKVGK